MICNLAVVFESEKLLEEVRYYQPEDAQPVEAYDGSGRMVPKIYGSTNMTIIGICRRMDCFTHRFNEAFGCDRW